MSGIEKLLEALVGSHARFIVVGAYAAIMQGSALRTDDLDICYERSPENHKRIIKAIGAFHPRPRGLPEHLKAPFDERSLAQGTNFTLTNRSWQFGSLGRDVRRGRIRGH